VRMVGNSISPLIDQEVNCFAYNCTATNRLPQTSRQEGRGGKSRRSLLPHLSILKEKPLEQPITHLSLLKGKPLEQPITHISLLKGKPLEQPMSTAPVMLQHNRTLHLHPPHRLLSLGPNKRQTLNRAPSLRRWQLPKRLAWVAWTG
jgi:hypothetical protein